MEDDVDNLHHIGDLYLIVAVYVGLVEIEYIRSLLEDNIDSNHHIGYFYFSIVVDVTL